MTDQTLPGQTPTIGRIVHYTLTEDDANQINRRRTTGKAIADRMLLGVVGYHTEPDGGSLRAWPAGAQAHIGNEAHAGDVFPMLITRVWGSSPSCAVNGQVFLDGTDVLWVLSRTVGDQPGQFTWPVRP